MPIIKIRGGQYSNIDQVGLDTLYSTLINAYIDEFDNVCKRPGYRTWASLPQGYPVRGLFFWHQKGKILAVCNGRVYKIGPDRVVYDATTDALTNTANQAIFASDGQMVWIASGGRMVVLDWRDTEKNAVFVSDVDAPMAVTHVAYLDGYIICNKLMTHQFFFTDPLDRTKWSSLDMASAEANPDGIVAIHTLWRELYLFGQKTVEVWYNDGVTPFSRLGGGTIEVGCSAPYSIVNVNNQLYWLDNHRRFIRLAGRSVEHLSIPIQRELDNATNISGAIAYGLSVRGKNWIILTIPAMNKTYCFDVDLKQWSVWGEWRGLTYGIYGGISTTTIDHTVSTYGLSQNRACGTGDNVTGIGTVAWTDPGKIVSGVAGYAFVVNTGVRYIPPISNRPSSATQQSFPNHSTWNNVTNCCQLDGQFATTTMPFGIYSNLLVASNFGFSIDSNRIIKRINVTVYGYCSEGADIWYLQLIKPNGQEFGIIHEQAEPISVVYNRITVGMDFNPGDILPSEVNSPDFKVRIMVRNVKVNTSTVYLDAIGVTVITEEVIDPVTTNYLRATNFQFSIPTDAKIMAVGVYGKAPIAQGSPTVASLRLVVGGNIVGSGLTSIHGSVIPQGDFSFVGYLSDWGVPSLAPVQVNASNFGIVLSVGVPPQGEIAIDDVEMVVFYIVTPEIFGTTGVLIGHRSNGKIYEVSDTYFRDDNATIRTEIKTGNITYGTHHRKRCDRLTIRGRLSDFSIRWIDDYTRYNPYIQFSAQNYCYLYRLGMYRSRQYELVHHKDEDFVLVEMEDSSEVLLK